MSPAISTLVPEQFPPQLKEIPQPPKQLQFLGQLPPAHFKLLTVVGSRKYTNYGKQIVDHIFSGLRGQPVGIVSGLALGIDGLAHETALKYNLYTLAIPGSGLGESVLYPAQNRPLAKQILDAGGGLLSEYNANQKAAKWTFPRRNRIVAGISHATLLIEAAEKSGTLITARLATDYNRDVLVVPGSIFSKNHEGIHQFLKLGATPVTNAAEVLEALGVPEGAAASPPPLPAPNLTPEQSRVLELLTEPRPRDELIRALAMDIAQATQLLMSMELLDIIQAEAGVYRKRG